MPPEFAIPRVDGKTEGAEREESGGLDEVGIMKGRQEKEVYKERDGGDKEEEE